MLPRQGRTRAYGPAASDPVRLVAQLAAVLSIGAGVIHISAAGDHTDLPLMFAGFMVVATLQIAIGSLLLVRAPSRLFIAGAAALMLSSIGMWVLSRTAGLPFIEGGHLEPIGFKDGVTKLFEIGSIPLLLLLLSRDLAGVSLPSPRLGSQTLAMVSVGCLALMTPALLLGGGEQHTHEEAVALGIHEHDGAHEGLAHPDEPESSHTHRGTAKHAGREEHAHSSDSGDPHRHAATELASTVGASHTHAPTPDDSHDRDGGKHGDSHRGGEHDADDNSDGGHKRGDHRDRDRGHGDHGDHGDEEEPGDGSGGQPISISYEPEPRVCVAGICFP